MCYMYYWLLTVLSLSLVLFDIAPTNKEVHCKNKGSAVVKDG